MQSSKDADGFDFQDFTGDSTLVEIDTSENANTGQTHTFKQFPDSATDEDVEGNVEQSQLLGDEAPTSGAIWTVEYYRKYFNVDTVDVRDRCIWSMMPKPGTNFLKDRLQHNPDLYGPFWICVTLVISIAVMGNLANYLQVAAQGAQYHWRYDFHKLTLAASVVFCYSWLVPLALWAVFWWRGHQANVTLLQLVCLYGYSLTVFVPISVLCAIGIWQLQWALILAGFSVSGAVLVVSLWSALSEERRQVALTVVTVILLLHLALSAGFLLYFFRAPTVAPVTVKPSVAATTLMAAAAGDSAHAPAAPAEAVAPAKAVRVRATRNHDVAQGTSADTAGPKGKAADNAATNNADNETSNAAAAAVRGNASAVVNVKTAPAA